MTVMSPSLLSEEFLHVNVGSDFFYDWLRSQHNLCLVCDVEKVNFKFERLGHFYPSFILFCARYDLNRLKEEGEG